MNVSVAMRYGGCTTTGHKYHLSNEKPFKSQYCVTNSDLIQRINIIQYVSERARKIRERPKEMIPDYVFVKYTFNTFKWFMKNRSNICAENFSPRKYKYLKNLSVRSVSITAV